MNYPKRSQYKYAKPPYRVRNWPDYEAGQRSRGDVTIGFSEGAIDGDNCSYDSDRGERELDRITDATCADYEADPSHLMPGSAFPCDHSEG